MADARTRSAKFRRIAAVTAGPVVGLVFLAAAYTKALDPRETTYAMEHLLSTAGVPAEAGVRALILGEIILGAMLIAGVARRVTLGAAALTLAAFSGWIIYLIATGSSISCGCGLGATWLEPGQARWAALARNGALILVTLFGFVEGSGLVWRRESDKSGAKRADHSVDGSTIMSWQTI